MKTPLNNSQTSPLCTHLSANKFEPIFRKLCKSVSKESYANSTKRIKDTTLSRINSLNPMLKKLSTRPSLLRSGTFYPTWYIIFNCLEKFKNKFYLVSKILTPPNKPKNSYTKDYLFSSILPKRASNKDTYKSRNSPYNCKTKPPLSVNK